MELKGLIDTHWQGKSADFDVDYDGGIVSKKYKAGWVKGRYFLVRREAEITRY